VPRCGTALRWPLRGAGELRRSAGARGLDAWRNYGIVKSEVKKRRFMRVRLLKHFKQSFSEQNYMVARHGNLPIAPFIGLQIDVRERNKESVPEYVVARSL
jgi:hypothetical protein